VSAVMQEAVDEHPGAERGPAAEEARSSGEQDGVREHLLTIGPRRRSLRSALV
jgi:hypothetical protein